jgi:hypothetical protein
MSQYPPPNHPQQSPSTPPGPLQYATHTNVAMIDLKQVALQQRAVNLCILAEIVVAMVRFALVSKASLPLALAMGMIYLAVAVIGAVFIFMLAISLYSTGAGIVMGILTLVPLVGLIVLLIVNSRATRVMRNHGIKVGLLGADPATIPPNTNVPRE